MSPKKPKTARKDPQKTPKVWEKARREKMKIYFNELQEVLPFYDPSTPMSRFEILQKSKICIKDLQDQNQDLLNGGFDEVYRNKMSKLKQRVKELLKRVDQLTDLLRAANIMIPPLEMYHHQEVKNGNSFKWMNQRPRKWTEKINLVVPDEKIKNVLSLIKVYKKNSGKINQKRRTAEAKIERNRKLNITDEEKTKKSMKKKKEIKNTKEKECENEVCDNNDSFNRSQSPSQFKENQPVDYNSLINNNGNNTNNDNGNNTNLNKSNKNSNNNNRNATAQNSRSNNTENSVGNGSSNTKDQKSQINNTDGVVDDVCAQILTLQDPTTKVGIPQTLVEAPHNIVLPTSSILQSNTFIFTNDGNLVQFPLLNSAGTVLNANSSLITPAATIIKPSARLLTPILINKPSPQVIVLQKPTTPIIQTAQILNATPQVISVSKPNIQFLSTCNPYTTSNTSSPKTLSHILSKPPGNKKRIMRDSTTTTYVNKIPIAALSKHSYTKKTNVTSCNGGEKNKSSDGKTKEVTGVSNVTPTGSKQTEPKMSISEDQNKEPIKEKAVKLAENEKLCLKQTENEKESFEEITSQEYVLESSGKRNLEDEKLENNKKTKLKENLEENFFKPIDNPMEAPIETDPMFCNLALPSSINPSLSVSPTAAFLSSFPIVAPIRSEAEDEVAEKKNEDDKSTKINEEHSHTDKMAMSKTSNNAFPQTDNFYANNQPPKISAHCPIQFGGNDQRQQQQQQQQQQQHQQNEMNYSKNDFYEKDQRCKTTEKRTDSKCYSKTPQNSYHGGNNSNNGNNNGNGDGFEFNEAHHQTEKMSGSKNGPIYASTVNYYEDNSNATKMTADCTIHFAGSDQSKIGYHKTDFYNKEQQPQHQQQQQQQQQQQHQPPRCKNLDKRTDSKCYSKNFQNSYNIFDYNYSGSCYGEDESNKYCNLQPYSGNKSKKGVNANGKKKSEGLGVVGNEDGSKRAPDQIVNNLDFNPVINQECFSWMPGKNVDWFPGKSFGLDGNLMVPSTLPTLVGDLALGTTTANDSTSIKQTGSHSKICGQANINSKALGNDMGKDCLDLGSGNGSNSMGKPMDAADTSKQYLEPFTNLSKNIFDLAPSNFQNPQIIKNDFVGNAGNIGNPGNNTANDGNNNNETIILKNIFELPVTKNSSTTSDFNMRHKQRNMNSNSQNTFLSVSQLVEPPPFDGSSVKNDGHMDAGNGAKGGQALGGGAGGGGGIAYNQTYVNYTAQKPCGKNKSRSSHCKYGGSGGNGDRKYQGYKNVGNGSSNNGGGGSSSYTAEALIRSNNSNSNTALNCHSNIEFSGVDFNTGYFNPKTSQSKPDQYTLGTDLNVKSDFQGPNQNIYSDFNFSSPVPNFAISSATTIDFGNHVDPVNGGNFPCQNNSYFGDYLPPDYPISDNMSNSLLIPPCSISLQSPFVIDKRSFPTEKGKSNSKQCSTSKSRKHYEYSKGGGFNDFSGPGTIFTTASLTCPTIFTTSACHNLLPVPTQSIPISFSSPSFTNGNGPLSFPPLVTTSGASDNYHHKFSGGGGQQNPGGPPDSTFSPNNPVFPPAYSSKSDSSSSASALPSASVQNSFTSNSVISSPFSVGCVPSLSTSTSQSAIPFFSLSNPIVPASLPTSSGNSLANFNLSTIFPEINQKGSYHYS